MEEWDVVNLIVGQKMVPYYLDTECQGVAAKYESHEDVPMELENFKFPGRVGDAYGCSSLEFDQESGTCSVFDEEKFLLATLPYTFFEGEESGSLTISGFDSRGSTNVQIKVIDRGPDVMLICSDGNPNGGSLLCEYDEYIYIIRRI